jgi:hypothetical protein
MPRIPVYEQRTTPSGLGPSARASGQQVASIGGALENLGRAGMGIAMDMQRRQEQDAEDDAAVAATTALAEGRLYWSKELQRRSDEWTPDGPGVYDSFTQDYDKWQQQQIASAGTPKAKRYLTERFAAMRSDFGVNAYQTDRSKRVGLNVSRWETGVEAARNTIFSDPDQRPVVLAEQLAGLEALTGIDPGKKLEIGQKLRQDLDLAAEQGYRARDGDTAYLGGRVRLVPTEVAPEQPDAAPSDRRPDFNQLFDAVVGQESGGRHTDGDGLLTSPKGARGVTQVMPATGADPGYGIKPLQNESREEYIRFGREYLAAMLREFDGDTAKALAAYNAGPGRVQAAVRVGGEDWLKNLPKETRDYVASIGGKVGLGQQAPADEARGFMLDGQRFEFLPDEELPATFQGLSIPQRMALLKEAEQEMKQRRATESQILQGRLRDSLAMAQNGITDAIPPEAFAVLGDKAADAFNEYQRAQRMATDIASLQGASNDELAAVASGAVRRAQPGTGYAIEDQMDGVRAQAAQQVLRAREADPAGYVAKNVPAVGRAMRTVVDPNMPPEQRAAAVQALTQESIAAQERLGITSPRVLSAAAVADLGRRISQARRPEDASDLVAALQMEYGDMYFPRVMNELMQAEKLSPALMIIPNLPDPAAREMVSALSTIKIEDLKVGLDPNEVRRIKEGAVEGASTLATSMPPIPGNGYVTLNSYQDMIERIAYERLRTGQDKSGTAAAESAARILLGHYQFEDGLRMPANVDASAIQRGLRVKRVRDVPQSMAISDVPTDLTGIYDDEAALLQWQEIVRSRGRWITSQDDQRAELWATGDDGQLFRVTQGGQQVSFGWDDIGREAVQAVQPRTGADRRGGLRNPAIIERMRRDTEALERSIEGN